MKLVMITAVIVLLSNLQVDAFPIGLFSDLDTFVEHANEIVIAKCALAPKGAEAEFEDGLMPATVDVVATLKGDRTPGELKIVTNDRMRAGESYLLVSSGGQAMGTNFLALGELSVIPIPVNFDMAQLKGKNTKQQIQLVMTRHLFEIEQKLAPLRHTERLLKKALEGKRDDLFESDGDIRIKEIRGARTKSLNSIVHLDFQVGRLEWSQSSAGESGYFYFQTSGQTTTWEFAPTDLKEIEDFNRKPLKAKFYGGFSPGRDARLGQPSGNAINVKVGQIILARTVNDPAIYIIKIQSQDQTESMTVQYTVIK